MIMSRRTGQRWLNQSRRSSRWRTGAILPNKRLNCQDYLLLLSAISWASHPYWSPCLELLNASDHEIDFS
jgi:hypothetical protein